MPPIMLSEFLKGISTSDCFNATSEAWLTLKSYQNMAKKLFTKMLVSFIITDEINASIKIIK